MQNKSDIEVVLDFSKVVAECRKRALLSKAYVARADEVAKHMQRVVTAKAFENLSRHAEELAERDLTSAPKN